MHNFIPAILCTVCAILQIGIMDYYLISFLGIWHLCWIALDAVTLFALFLSFHDANSAIRQSEQTGEILHGTRGWIAWLFLSNNISVKFVVISNFAGDKITKLQNTFFDSTTLKTTIGLAAFTFFLLVLTQHNAPQQSVERRRIYEMTQDVVYDLIDTSEILEMLFTEGEESLLRTNIKITILAIAVLNLILPIIPLLRLNYIHYGQIEPNIKNNDAHRICLALTVNLPSLVVRILMWHGLRNGISAFALKNVLIIFLAFYDVFGTCSINTNEIGDKTKVEVNSFNYDSYLEKEPTGADVDNVSTDNLRPYGKYPKSDKVSNLTPPDSNDLLKPSPVESSLL